MGLPVRNFETSIDLTDKRLGAMYFLFFTYKHLVVQFFYSEVGVYTIEVKNWVGEVVPSNDGKMWIQRKQDMRNDKAQVTYEVNHDSALESLRLKTQLLRSHLLKNEACLPQKFFHPRVVFANHLTKLDSSLTASKEIVSPEDYLKFVESFRWGVASKLFNSFVPGLLTGKAK